MNKILKELVDHMHLEKIEQCLFRGESRDIGVPRVFGGQVLGQALRAAQTTVEDRTVHSLYAYFLRPGDIKSPIIYEVDKARDGMSFSMRRVVAIQHGRQIFNLSASFQKEEQGFEHQAPMPDVSAPEELMDSRELAEKLDDKISSRQGAFMRRERPFEFRFVEQEQILSGAEKLPLSHVWFKTVDKLPDDEDLHRVLLAYVSDYNLIRTATLPHQTESDSDKLQLASLDHAMWFHRSARVDDWLLYAMDSPNTGGSRGLARGMIFDRQGTLLASTAQEGLLRIIKRT